MLKSKSVPRVAAGLCVALFVYAVVASSALPVRAQETQPAQRRDGAPASATPTPTPSTPAANAAATRATGDHDLSITANVTARELLFEVVPNPKVEFPGRPRRDTVWEAERTNLPAQVQPGVTYRDIGIRLTITSVFADIERIVAEALGEIPASDGNNVTPPTPEPNPNATPPPTEHAPRATPDVARTSAAPQGSSAIAQAETSTPTARVTPAQTTSAQTAPSRRKNSGHATARRGRN